MSSLRCKIFLAVYCTIGATWCKILEPVPYLFTSVKSGDGAEVHPVVAVLVLVSIMCST